ncbi:helix-turn-helix domain-containing protein [Magnetovibrio blakemorei]
MFLSSAREMDAPGFFLLSSNSKQARRLLALSLIYDGASRSDAARHANVDVQSIRDWVLRFNAKGPDGLIDLKSTGARRISPAIWPSGWKTEKWTMCGERPTILRPRAKSSVGTRP